MNTKLRLPAEWEEQAAIMLAWPHEKTDWDYMLDEVQNCFKDIATAISANKERLIILTPDPESAKRQLAEIDSSNITFCQIQTNDTWARDTCAITTLSNEKPIFNDFKFNGWGLKFAADHDNLITSTLYHRFGLLNGEYENCLNFVLEGGAIESDGCGLLLTTSQCLLSKNRNGGSSKSDIENFLKNKFGAEKILWLDHGFLAGDDTDSHIDTLARLAPNNTILYVGTGNQADMHYHELALMKRQLESFSTLNGTPFKLIELPLPDPIFDESGERLPATYANFLIANGFVLVPTYGQPLNDECALARISEVFPDRQIIGIDCNALIKQHGSLHCVTMQFPKKSII